MDHRDFANLKNKWWETLDRDRMRATVFLGEDENGEEEEVEIPIKFEVCPTCEGKGKHVNPSIDAHGLSAEDFAEDPDFAEDYFRGCYDVSCYECGGANVVPEIDEDRCDKETLKKVREHQEVLHEIAREQAYQMRMGF